MSSLEEKKLVQNMTKYKKYWKGLAELSMIQLLINLNKMNLLKIFQLIISWVTKIYLKLTLQEEIFKIFGI